MHKVAFLLVVLGHFICSEVNAQEKNKKSIDSLRAQEYSVKTITPIFSQLLMLSFPKGFKPAFENTKGNNYIQESVREGETVDEWSQMITMTGAKGLVANPNASPQGLAEGIAAAFKRACPDTFSIKAIGKLKVSGYDAFAGLVGCGTMDFRGSKHSESALIISIKGAADYYTIQWAERAAVSSQPVVLDSAKWADRFKQLTPIKVCPVVPGEAAPFPSCLSQK